MVTQQPLWPTEVTSKTYPCVRALDLLLLLVPNPLHLLLLLVPLLLQLPSERVVARFEFLDCRAVGDTTVTAAYEILWGAFIQAITAVYLWSSLNSEGCSWNGIVRRTIPFQLHPSTPGVPMNSSRPANSVFSRSIGIHRSSSEHEINNLPLRTRIRGREPHFIKGAVRRTLNASEQATSENILVPHKCCEAIVCIFLIQLPKGAISLKTQGSR